MKPIISVVGNHGSPIPTLTKILWSNSTFVAGEHLNHNSTPPMPINLPGNAPYVFSFLNPLAADPKFRISLSNYTTVKPGDPGTSVFWVFDPTGPSWVQKGQPSPMNPPFNPYAFANIKYGASPYEVPYLVVADYDSANNNGGTLCLVSMSSTDAYARVASLGIANQTSGGYTYQAHVQDVHVDGDRIFALVIYSSILSTAPFNLQYIQSELREYALTGSGSNIAFTQVGATRALSKNAVSLVPYIDSVNSKKYLFAPCIGGMQNFGPLNNGAESSLSLFDITSAIGYEQKPYIGGVATGLHDFRGFAISSDGIAYILTGDYGTDGSMSCSLYQDTAANLIGKASGTIPRSLLIKSAVNTSAYFWALGICDNGYGEEYLAFAKGSNYDPTAIMAYDELHLLKVGQTWSDIGDTYNVIIPPNSVTGGVAGLTEETSGGFAINSMDISVLGGLSVRMKSAVRPPHAPKSPDEPTEEPSDEPTEEPSDKD
ncbi:MAG: hypothetical protein LBO66_09730 [Deltaproteobacteria bacterium]|jgi:hypothetical protein|nr:hypothetical protein [Deltaproteobacteria bacterium]